MGVKIKLFALAVIAQAVKDWRSQAQRRQQEAELRKFFKSEWFESLSAAAGIEAEAVRKQCEGL